MSQQLDSLGGTDLDDGSDSSDGGNSAADNIQHINYIISFVTTQLSSTQAALTNDENSTQWPQQRLMGMGSQSITQERAIDSDKKNIADYSADLNALNDVKAKVANSTNQLSSCQSSVQKIYQNDQPAMDHIKALSAEMASANTDDLTALKNEMNKDCPIVVIGGVLGMFTPDAGIDAYGKTYQLAESGTVHLIKSDNGWVIQ
jgi:CHASE3 domain sensor protein